MVAHGVPLQGASAEWRRQGSGGVVERRNGGECEEGARWGGARAERLSATRGPDRARSGPKGRSSCVSGVATTRTAWGYFRALVLPWQLLVEEADASSAGGGLCCVACSFAGHPGWCGRWACRLRESNDTIVVFHPCLRSCGR